MHREMNTTVTTEAGPISEADVLEKLAIPLPHLRSRLRPEHPLNQLGLDSIDLVELLCVVESEFRVSITEHDLASVATVGGLARLIAARRNEARSES